ncbi:MAG: Amuc_1102 family pilus-like protein [Verrucomicrobiota bacterium]
MNILTIRTRRPSTCTVFALTILMGIMALQAQVPAPTKVAVDVKEVEAIMQKTPEFQFSVSDSKKDGKRKEWFELEIEFETKSDSKIKQIPELQVAYYLAIASPAGNQIYTGQFNYTNIIDDEENFSVVYISPAGLTRIAGEPRKFRLGDVKAWGVEFLYQGRVVGGDVSSGNIQSPWWAAGAASQYPRVAGLLLPKEKTPFRLCWIDRHVELKSNN